ncbi:MAG: 3-deoxy-manno-octulosonate cytidylyltransferase [Ignavibacteria bacterium]|nr:3-deoxy-manno-octulosonate cytidylyltransferase [Ignavibacteria bacterium]
MIVAIIPARYGSTRLAGKPLADINGKPMIRHVYERVQQATLVDKVLVATDDRRIALAVESFGGQAVMTSATMTTGTDRIAFVARSVPDADIVVNVQGDEPLIVPEMIDEAVTPLINDTSVSVGTLVREIRSLEELRNPNIVKVVMSVHGSALYFSRAVIPYGRDLQEEELLRRHRFYKHIGLYVFRREFLIRLPEMAQTPLELTEKLEQLRILESGVAIRATLTQHDSIPVDTQADLDRVREIARTLL